MPPFARRDSIWLSILRCRLSVVGCQLSQPPTTDNCGGGSFCANAVVAQMRSNGAVRTPRFNGCRFSAVPTTDNWGEGSFCANAVVAQTKSNGAIRTPGFQWLSVVSCQFSRPPTTDHRQLGERS